MATINLHPDFKELLKLLNAHNVEYLLVGGYAVGSYGYVRATADLDIWVNCTKENSIKLVNALEEFGFGDNVNEAMFRKDNNIVRMGLPPFRIEIMTSVSGVSFTECYERRNDLELEGLTINIIGLEDLKKNKLASARHKDLNDLEYLP
ncbi:MAG: hypothetical protein IPG59_11430 [Candidatus Melainabacteria bacterium]|nr:MAG: hypothetical protein IPG59_11430 [Candidatus Melainabacteria bacterium]